jgi:hypothetical protein
MESALIMPAFATTYEILPVGESFAASWNRRSWSSQIVTLTLTNLTLWNGQDGFEVNIRKSNTSAVPSQASAHAPR